MSFLSNFLSKLWNYIFTSSHLKTTTTTTTRSTTTRSDGVSKKALCIGIIDYPGTKNDLSWCVEDAKKWSSILNEMYGFSVDMLLDKEANVKKVKSTMIAMLKKAKAGDSIVITYSGHGSNVPDTGGDEEDGRDETWYLYDGNLKDDSIRKVIKTLPEGVNLTIISDSCHSGGVTRNLLNTLSSGDIKARFMPPEDDMEAAVINTLPLLRNIFSDDDMNHVLLSGCKSNEFSYDAGEFKMGAMSHYATSIIENNQDITYNELHKQLRKKLPSRRYPQSPLLEGSDADKNKPIFQ